MIDALSEVGAELALMVLLYVVPLASWELIRQAREARQKEES